MMCLWRPEENLRAIHLLSETMSLTVTWNSTSRSGWLASEPQEAHLSLSPQSWDVKLTP